MYPRHCLSYHFWTLQQRNEFAIINIKNRLEYNRKVFRFLQAKLSDMKKDKHYEQWRHVLGLMGSGLHPSPKEILDVKDVFKDSSYQMSSLGHTHIVSLSGWSCLSDWHPSQFHWTLPEEPVRHAWLASWPLQICPINQSHEVHSSHGCGHSARGWRSQYACRCFAVCVLHARSQRSQYEQRRPNRLARAMAAGFPGPQSEPPGVPQFVVAFADLIGVQSPQQLAVALHKVNFLISVVCFLVLFNSHSW